MLRKTTRGLQGDPHLTEALTRAFMFADSSVATEIHSVGMQLSTMLTRAMDPDRTEPTDDDIAIARVIGDVWLSVPRRLGDRPRLRRRDRRAHGARGPILLRCSD